MAFILVVEDEESVRDLLLLYLEKEGFQVELASDGEEALKKMSEFPLISFFRPHASQKRWMGSVPGK